MQKIVGEGKHYPDSRQFEILVKNSTGFEQLCNEQLEKIEELEIEVENLKVEVDSLQQENEDLEDDNNNLESYSTSAINNPFAKVF